MQRSLRVRQFALVLSGLLLFSVSAGLAGYAPWMEILRANTDGTNVERILARERALATGPIKIDPDLGSTPLYWGALDVYDQSPWGGPVPKIWRAGAYGFGAWNVATWGFAPFDIDPVADKIYWVVSTDCEPCDGVHRANLDGSNREQVFGSDIAVHGLAVDPVEGKIYWQGTDYSFDERMWSINYDGTDLQELFPAGPAFSLAIDVSARKLYWSDHGTSSIRRSNFDGSEMEILVEGLNAASLTLDPAGNRMWWIEYALGTVSRSTLDGTDVTQLISGLDQPGGVAYMPSDGTAVEKIYIVANPGELDVPVPAVSGKGAMALVLLLLAVATAIMLRRG